MNDNDYPCGMAELSRRGLLAGALAVPLAACAVAGPAAAAAQPGDPEVPGFGHHVARLPGVDLHYTLCGSGSPVLLLHGWPMTWYAWARVIPALARHHTVIAPDLRGIGGSSRPAGGYDFETQAQDALALLKHLGWASADVVGHDLGCAIAFTLAVRQPQAVKRLMLMEAVLFGLPGAEAFLQHKPWWFAFHDVPDLAETVLVGNEGVYLDWFYTHHSYGGRGVGTQARNRYVAAYTGREALRGGFAHYRAFGESTRQMRQLAGARLRAPTLALGGNVVGDVLFKQLAGVADSYRGEILPQCGHFIPDERPDELLRHMQGFLT